MSIAAMYVEHWKKPGFWVHRQTWGNTIAKVIYVDTLKNSLYPYYGNPNIFADVYNIHTGELLDHEFCLPCPGTYSWNWVDPPVWSDEQAFDFYAERILIPVPYEQRLLPKKMKELIHWSYYLKSWWIKEGDEKALLKARKLGLLTAHDSTTSFVQQI